MSIQRVIQNPIPFLILLDLILLTVWMWRWFKVDNENAADPPLHLND